MTGPIERLSDAQRARLQQRLRHGAERAERPLSSIPRRREGGPAPLSFPQEQLWYLCQLAGETPLYNETVVITRHGPLDAGTLQRALAEVVRRHQIWRTTFVTRDGRPLQVVQPPFAQPVPVTDLYSHPPAGREAEVARIAREEGVRPFDLERGPLWRPHLVRLAPDDHRLILSLHHLIFDGASIFQVLLPELDALLANGGVAPPALAELPLQYSDFACWQRAQVDSEEMRSQLGYWQRRLEGAPVLELVSDQPPPPVRSFRGALHRFRIPVDVRGRLHALARAEGVTLFTVLAASLQTLLHRYTGLDDVVLGTLSAGRSRPELGRLLGYFANAVALRLECGGDPTFRSLLRPTSASVMEAVANDEVPFERVVAALAPVRSGGRNPIFQTCLTLEPALPRALKGWAATSLGADLGTAKFDLELALEDTPAGLECGLRYSADLFEEGTACRLAGHWQTLLRAVLEGADRPLSRLPLIDEAERRQVLVEWNRTDVEKPSAPIHELFESEARRAPNCVAVTVDAPGRPSLTYRELDERANQLAHHLRRVGVGRGVPVGICLPRSLDLVVALLGVLKAGGVYLPLDPDHPLGRLVFVLDDAKAPVVVTSEALAARLPNTRELWRQDVQLVCLDREWLRIAASPQTPPPGGATVRDLAYILYTSGTTGQPKGVLVEHRSVVRLVRPATFATLDEDEVLLQLAPLDFDASTLEIWGALLNGGRLVLARPGQLSLRELGDLVAREGVTTVWLTAGLFNQLVEAGLPGFGGVRQLLTGGEALSPEHCARALELLPRVRLVNGYGPTETTTFACCHPVTQAALAGRSVPIGRPIGNTRVYILDEAGGPAPIGVPGELYIGGAGVARGYLNQPELTAERFVPDPYGELGDRLYRSGDLARFLPGGEIEFLGRRDRQVKIRGYRIEPGEVEAALSRHPDVAEAAVDDRRHPALGHHLVAYVVPRGIPDLRWDRLREFLSEQLPAYLIPSRLVVLDRIPLTSSGKVDRRALPDPPTDAAPTPGARVGPRTPLEAALARIWGRVLGRAVGVHDDFFDLGGHSLLLVRMLAEVETAVGRRVPVTAIFRGGATVSGLAAYLETAAPSDAAPPTDLVHARPGAGSPLVFVDADESGMAALRHFLRVLDPRVPVVGLVPPRERRLFDRWGSLEQLVEQLVERLLEHQPRGPYYLCGHSLGGLLVYEVVSRLAARGQRVAWLGLLDTMTPEALARAATAERSPAARAARLAGYVSLLSRDGPRKIPRTVGWMVTTRARRLGTQFGLPLLRRDMFDYQGALLLGMRHRATGNEVPLDLFTTAVSEELSGSPTLGWERLHRGPLRSHRVSGDHNSLLQEPHVHALLEALLASLEIARTQAEGA